MRIVLALSALALAAPSVAYAGGEPDGSAAVDTRADLERAGEAANRVARQIADLSTPRVIVSHEPLPVDLAVQPLSFPAAGVDVAPVGVSDRSLWPVFAIVGTAGAVCAFVCGGSGSAPGIAPPGSPPPGVAPIPEPATWAMLLLGFGAIGAAIRRAKRASMGGRRHVAL